jgi:hypothetical protein
MTTTETMMVVVVKKLTVVTVIIQFFVYVDTDTQQPNDEIQSTSPEKNKVIHLT